VRGDVYRPAAEAPGIVLVHGAALLGKDDPRLVRLARSLARAGRLVFVPQLRLAERRFVPGDLDRIVRAVLAVEERDGSSDGPSMLGISYGGSFALVAAADPRIQGRLVQVAVFGAYFDLAGVLQAVTTGVSIVGDRRIPWEGPPEARSILEEGAADLAPAASPAGLGEALARKDPSGLSADGRALYQVLVNRDPARTRELVAELSPRARRVFERFSPSSVADEIEAPVIAMHSLDDPAVPFAEAIRLSRGLPEARLVVVRGFRHVDFAARRDLGTALGDLWGAWRFASWLLAAQE
jgi:acetyl esterase/lipase